MRKVCLFYNQNNKSLWLSNMADTYFEKFTRCAKVYGRVCLVMLFGRWLARQIIWRSQVVSLGGICSFLCLDSVVSVINFLWCVTNILKGPYSCNHIFFSMLTDIFLSREIGKTINNLLSGFLSIIPVTVEWFSYASQSHQASEQVFFAATSIPAGAWDAKIEAVKVIADYYSYIYFRRWSDVFMKFMN